MSGPLPLQFIDPLVQRTKPILQRLDTGAHSIVLGLQDSDLRVGGRGRGRLGINERRSGRQARRRGPEDGRGSDRGRRSRGRGRKALIRSPWPGHVSLDLALLPRRLARPFAISLPPESVSGRSRGPVVLTREKRQFSSRVLHRRQVISNALCASDIRQWWCCFRQLSQRSSPRCSEKRTFKTATRV